MIPAEAFTPYHRTRQPRPGEVLYNRSHILGKPVWLRSLSNWGNAFILGISADACPKLEPNQTLHDDLVVTPRHVEKSIQVATVACDQAFGVNLYPGLPPSAGQVLCRQRIREHGLNPDTIVETWQTISWQREQIGVADIACPFERLGARAVGREVIVPLSVRVRTPGMA
jgi:hypothetical protein